MLLQIQHLLSLQVQIASMIAEAFPAVTADAQVVMEAAAEAEINEECALYGYIPFFKQTFD